MKRSLTFVCVLLLVSLQQASAQRPRFSDLKIPVGVFKSGRYNAITDVKDVRVGQVTLVRGDSIRTGATAILPHGGNLFADKVEGAVVVGNGFGKLIGSTQINELGQIETPIVLTNTLNVWEAANGIADYMLSLPENADVRSINPVVGETNDGFLNDIRGRWVTRQDVVSAIRSATNGPVEEGCVGAGTGTVCNGWKGGIGTSSRVLPPSMGGYTVGVLVQTNYGGILDIAGVPVGKELGKYAFQRELGKSADGSCMIVVATDAPVGIRQLQRLALRATLALGRTGSAMSHGSGDYVIAFTNAIENRTRPTEGPTKSRLVLSDEYISALFQAAVEATEEAIYNSLFKAVTTKGYGGRIVEALPFEKVEGILKKYGRLP